MLLAHKVIVITRPRPRRLRRLVVLGQRRGCLPQLAYRRHDLG